MRLAVRVEAKMAAARDTLPVKVSAMLVSKLYGSAMGHPCQRFTASRAASSKAYTRRGVQAAATQRWPRQCRCSHTTTSA